MTRLYLRFSLLLLMAFIIPEFVIRAQPYDDGDLRALLLPDGCEMPCFMGIRPGVTTMDEAIAILQSHAWVESVEPHPVGPGRSFVHVQGWVYWDWKSDAPVWFRSRLLPAGIHAGSFDILDGIVQDITVATDVPFARIWLARGEPSEYRLGFNLVMARKMEIKSAILRYQESYLQNDIELDEATLCHAAWNAWFQPSSITIMNTQQPEGNARFAHDLPVMLVARSLRSNGCSGR